MKTEEDLRDWISDKTRLNISVMAAAGYKVEQVQEGKTRGTDKFRVLFGGEVIVKMLQRKSFVSFLNRHGLDLHYKPVVDKY